jgi:hypothetical protein
MRPVHPAVVVFSLDSEKKHQNKKAIGQKVDKKTSNGKKNFKSKKGRIGNNDERT